MSSDMAADPALRPAAVCRALLAALDAAEGRRHARKRDQTPDAIGLSIKRDLLEKAIAADPPPETFEAWLMAYSMASAPDQAGSRLAMARAVFEEWRLARSLGAFRDWLEDGAPSADKR